jgi:pyruvate/2-oxoglutarate dehydrogenase complex dihydrolipoamide acyltransferase (E2) component
VTGPSVAPELPEGYEELDHSVERLRPRRRAAARAFERAATVPSLTADVRVDMTRVVEVRGEWDRTPKPSVLALVITAAVDALADHRSLNATYTEKAIVRWAPFNIGVAVDSPDGLVVPVIRNAGGLGAAAITERIADLAARARGRALVADDLQAGTFTVSNPGAIAPSVRAEALLNPPQVALLGLPGLVRTPVAVRNGQEEVVAVRPLLVPSLTFDHRAVDGGEALRYLVALRDRLERWGQDDYEQPSGCSEKS